MSHLAGPPALDVYAVLQTTYSPWKWGLASDSSHFRPYPLFQRGSWELRYDVIKGYLQGKLGTLQLNRHIRGLGLSLS